MAGYWYAPPPPQPAALHVPPNAVAQGNAPPTPIGPGTQLDAIRSAWPQESWPAQTGDIVASQLATPWASPQPQPFYATRPLDALIRSLWPPESWPSQVLTGGGVGAITATPAPALYAPIGPLARAIAATISAAWPPEAWAAQMAGDTASLLAVVTTPVIFPSPLPVLRAALVSMWLPESWRAQSEAGIASGIAQIQLPPIYQPWSTVSRTALLRSLWLPEDWPAQAGARYAAWIPPPATAIPAAIRHPEILLWSPETWGAQPGTREAALFAATPPAQPYVNRWLSAVLRAAWLPEDWRAQSFPDIAAGTSPLPAPLPHPPSQFTISLWPVEFWGPQGGTRDAAILAPAQLIVFMPFVVGLPSVTAIAELQSLFAAAVTLQYVYSGAPTGIVVYQSIAAGTEVALGTAVTLQVSLGRPIGPAPCPIVESILVSNIPVVLSLMPSNVKVIH